MPDALPPALNNNRNNKYLKGLSRDRQSQIRLLTEVLRAHPPIRSALRALIRRIKNPQARWTGAELEVLLVVSIADVLAGEKP